VKTEIIPVKESQSSDYDKFLEDLPETECCWAVYDLEFQNDEGSLRKKIIFLQWYVGWLFNDYFYLCFPLSVSLF